MPESYVERYEHSPLQGLSSIRLLTLLPGNFGTPLRCQIAEFQEHSYTSYEALSYTWGDFGSPEIIHICGSDDLKQTNRVVPITRTGPCNDYVPRYLAGFG